MLHHPTYVKEITLHMAGEGEFVLVFMLPNRAYLLTLPGSYGDSILNVRGGKMGRLFQLIIQQRGYYLGLCRIQNRLDAVCVLCERRANDSNYRQE